MESLDWQFAGLPLHPLFVHAAVVLMPLAALMIVATAVWPAAARKLTWLTPAAAIVAGGFALLAHSSGEWLEERVAPSAALATHVSYSELMNPMAVVLVASAVLLWGWQRFARPRLTARPPPGDHGGCRGRRPRDRRDGRGGRRRRAHGGLRGAGGVGVGGTPATSALFRSTTADVRSPRHTCIT